MTTSTPLALPATKSNGRVAYTGGVVEDETHKPRSSSNNRANLRNGSAEAQQTGRLSTNAPRHPCEPPRSPLSNVSRFKIIDSTLREGEQFATAFFDTNSKMQIVKALDELGVDYIELTSPAASEQSRRDCEDICKLELRAKVVAHVRCHMDDVKIAIESGVKGVNLFMGTSSYLMDHSHGKDLAYIKENASRVIRYAKSRGVEVRFSTEDSFRSNLVELLSIYRIAEKAGADRVGIADTVGCATPRQVYDLVRTLRSIVSCDIETHFHNDTGCAIANAYCALEAGATHIDTTVLGIGERNGITPLGGLITRMLSSHDDDSRVYVSTKYALSRLAPLEVAIACVAGVRIPFNNFSICAAGATAASFALTDDANRKAYETGVAGGECEEVRGVKRKMDAAAAVY